MPLSLCMVVNDQAGRSLIHRDAALLVYGRQRPGRSLAATSVPSPSHPGCLFYVHDRCSNTNFLVDTGAEVSVIAPSLADPHSTFSLQAVNGSQIATFGVRSCTLNLGLRRTFRSVFIIADVKQAILDADFLQHFGLTVDLRHHTLSDSTTHLQINGLSSSQSSSTGLTQLQQDPTNPYLCLLAEFPSVTQACTANRPVNTMWFTISRSLVHQRSHVLTAWPQNAYELLDRNSTTCWNLVLSALHQVAGHHLCTWSPSALSETGGRVETFVPLTRQLSQTGIPFLIFKILQLPCKEPPSSHTLTSFVHIIRSL